MYSFNSAFVHIKYTSNMAWCYVIWRHCTLCISSNLHTRAQVNVNNFTPV